MIHADPSSRLPFARLIIVQLAILVALFAAAEVLLWVVAPITDRDSLSIRQDLPGLKQNVHYATIGSGVRSLTQQTLRKPTGSTRLLCLGASTTDQATQDVENTWCALIEQQLKATHANLETSFHTLSYGSGGNRAMDSLIWLNARIDRIEPDIVVTLLGFNDVMLGGGADFVLRDVETALAGERLGATARAKRLCLSISQICRRAQIAWRRFSRNEGFTTGSQVEWHSSNLPRLRTEYRSLPVIDEIARNPDPIQEFEAATRALLNLLGDRGADVIVLGQPTIWKPVFTTVEFDALWFPLNTPAGYMRASGNALSKEMDRFNDMQRKLAQENDAAFVDLGAMIPKDLEHFFDDCHFTDRGSRAVAEAILPALEKIVLNRVERR